MKKNIYYLLLCATMISCSSGYHLTSKKVIKQQRDSLACINMILRAEKGKLIERILKDNEIELTELKGQNLENISAVERREIYSQMPIDSLESLLKWVKEVSF